MNFKVILLLIFVRIASIFIVQTFFSPDEYWQSLEVAHKLTFGYGHLTWEWTHGIRSYLHPVIIAAAYKLLEFINFDSTWTIVYIPRILQALLSAFADYRFYLWCNQKKWSLFIIISSWFWFYTGSRTLINTFETSLTTVALSIYPWNRGKESTSFIWIVGLLAYIRPTSIFSWVPLCIHHIIKSKYSAVDLIIKRYLLVAIVIGGILSSLDTYFHGSFIITPYEFFKFNVMKGVASFYGSHAWHWYFTSGFPAVMGIFTVPFFLAIGDAIKYWERSKERQILLQSITFTIVILSLLAHKEFRFLMVILPMCLYICTEYMAKWSRSKSQIMIWTVAVVLFISNVIPAVYLGHFHQRAPSKVMDKIATIAKEKNDMKVFFLMPCHSTPYFSHVHVNVTMRFLTCEPNLNNKENYRDQAEYFYEAPMSWIRKHLPVRPIKSLPTHVVLYDTIANRISEFLSIYKPVEIFEHSDYLTSIKGGKNIIIYERMEIESSSKHHDQSET